MTLSDETWSVLRTCGATDRRPAFRAEADVIRYWNRTGAIGFLNIRDVTPKMVAEIRAFMRTRT